MRKRTLGILTAVSFLIGALLVSFPVWERFNKLQQLRNIVSEYEQRVQVMDEFSRCRQQNVSQWYNLCLMAADPPEGFEDSYESILNISDGMMGYLRVPSLKLEFPVYHGSQADTDMPVLGHVPGTSFPIGGEGNHTILTAPEPMKALQNGDLILINTLQQILVYEVNQVQHVPPGYAEGRDLNNTEDLCTFVVSDRRGMERSKVMIRAGRVSEADEQAVLDDPMQGPLFSKEQIKLAAAASGAVLVLPVFTGCIGYLSGKIKKILNCCRLTKIEG